VASFVSSLADLPELFGFFSYSREDDDDSNGALSALRNRIQRELRGQFGRTRTEFKLFQDTVAISHGTLWAEELKSAIARSLFFVPIITPTAVNSRYCKAEFELFLEREAEMGREDLIFPILYIRVPALESEDQRRKNDVLGIIHVRQFANWTDIRLDDVASPAVGRRIERFCHDIVEALSKQWVLPEERRRQEEEAKRNAEAERRRETAAEAERQRFAEAAATREAEQKAQEEAKPSGERRKTNVSKKRNAAAGQPPKPSSDRRRRRRNGSARRPMLRGVLRKDVGDRRRMRLGSPNRNGPMNGGGWAVQRGWDGRSEARRSRSSQPPRLS
jgi:hypothetical protein